jgi:hypothetical protein
MDSGKKYICGRQIIIEDMIKWIIANHPEPVTQQGENVIFYAGNGRE